MKKGLVLILLVVLGAALAVAQYPQYTIRQVQEVSLDSLRLADQLQRTANTRWRLQTSPLFKTTTPRDTITVVGVCVVPAKVVNFTSFGYNLLIADTGSPDIWGALFVRPNISSSTNPGDTAKAIQWGALNVQAGDLIKVVGYIDEFPANDMVSYTQLVPLYEKPIEILGTATVPKHKRKQVADFYQRSFPGTIKFSTGEPYEMMLVELTDLTVSSILNTTNGTFTLVDADGNEISTMDASKWFTTRTHRDPASTYALPLPFTKVDTIRGYIMTNSGSEAARGYRLAPLYPGDIKYGAVLPLISQHRRNPVVVPPDSAARISARVVAQPGGSAVSSVTLYYGTGGGPFTALPMTYRSSDTTYHATIPQQPADTFVRYFIEARDAGGDTIRLASSAFGGASSDTSKGFFFYTSLNRPLMIRDIQYTPYTNGRSPYLGAVATVAGVVTVDTTQIGLSPLNTAGTNAWYIQNGNAPWSGIWIAATDTAARRKLAALRSGDSVIVTGTVAENFDVTQLSNVQSGVVVAAAGQPVAAPVVLPTGNFGPNSGNGSPLAEPYEGMLVRFNNVTVTDLYPTYSDPTEFTVDGGTGPVIVRRDGTNTYTNVPADTAFGKKLLRVGDNISFLTGVMYYSFNRYKLTPRANADFGVVTVGVEDRREGILPESFALDQNYPNPFNPSTTIAYGLPRSGFVTLKVYNILGQEVRTLVSGPQAAGRHTIRFDASSLATGLYLYRIHVVPESGAEFSLVKKMVLMK